MRTIWYFTSKSILVFYIHVFKNMHISYIVYNLHIGVAQRVSFHLVEVLHS